MRWSIGGLFLCAPSALVREYVFHEFNANQLYHGKSSNQYPVKQIECHGAKQRLQSRHIDRGDLDQDSGSNAKQKPAVTKRIEAKNRYAKTAHGKRKEQRVHGERREHDRL